MKKKKEDVPALMFPKTKKVRKVRKKHPKSIMHDKAAGTCYLCMILHDDYTRKPTTEHHIFFGAGKRQLSEEWGMKVYLCGEHHTAGTGPEAVHGNTYLCRMLQAEAEEIFNSTYTESFKEIFGESYIERWQEMKKSADEKIAKKKCIHLEKNGDFAVHVKIGCPHKKEIRGIYLTPKMKCAECPGVKR